MKKILLRFAPLFGLIFVYLLFILIIWLKFVALSDSPDGGPLQSFISFYNTKTIITQTVIVGIAALGMTLVIVSGGIDLSVGSQIALGTVVIATLLNLGGGDVTEASAASSLLAALGSMAACAVCGLLIGLLTSRLNIVPFIITLGMMQIARGVAKWIGKEQTVSTPVNGLQRLMLTDPEPSWLVFAPGVWIAVILLVLTTILMKYTVFGRYIFAIGSNEKTARLCGINVPLNRVFIYTLNSAFVGVAAIMQYSNLTVGDPTAAVGMELDIIAAVVIGGGSLSGGEGSASGSIIGALIMAVLRNGCNMLGVPNFVQEVIIGAIIIGAVAIDRLKHRIQG